MLSWQSECWCPRGKVDLGPSVNMTSLPAVSLIILHLLLMDNCQLSNNIDEDANVVVSNANLFYHQQISAQTMLCWCWVDSESNARLLFDYCVFFATQHKNLTTYCWDSLKKVVFAKAADARTAWMDWTFLPDWWNEFRLYYYYSKYNSTCTTLNAKLALLHYKTFKLYLCIWATGLTNLLQLWFYYEKEILREISELKDYFFHLEKSNSDQWRKVKLSV